MKKTLNYILIPAMMIFMAGCGEDESGQGATTLSTKVVQGWHFQGRDCLACHNVDLQKSRHLVFGGTLYKDKNVSNQDDLKGVCGGDFIINYLDSTSATVYSSKDYIDTKSKGNKGKGNLYVLKRMSSLIQPGGYTIKVTTQDGTLMAISAPGTHNFISQNYDINKSVDYQNRISCNACHRNNGATSPIFVNFTANKTLCQ